MVNLEDDGKARLAEKQSHGNARRFYDGTIGNWGDQLTGLGEIFTGGKPDQLASLTGTFKGEPVRNSGLVNLTRTTANVASVLGQVTITDRVGLTDGSTSRALGKAFTAKVDQFNAGTTGDKWEMGGEAFGLVSSFLIGGGGAYKGATNLATDVRVMKGLVQAEQRGVRLGETVTAMRNVTRAETRLAQTVEAANAARTGRVVQEGTAATRGAEVAVASTAPIQPGLMTRFTTSVRETAGNLANRVDGLLGRGQPAFDFALPGGGSLSSRALTGAGNEGRATTLLRTTEQHTGGTGTSLLGRGRNAVVNEADNVVPGITTTERRVAGTGTRVETTAGRATTPHTVETPPVTGLTDEAAHTVTTGERQAGQVAQRQHGTVPTETPPAGGVVNAVEHQPTGGTGILDETGRVGEHQPGTGTRLGNREPRKGPATGEQPGVTGNVVHETPTGRPIADNPTAGTTPGTTPGANAVDNVTPGANVVDNAAPAGRTTTGAGAVDEVVHPAPQTGAHPTGQPVRTGAVDEVVTPAPNAGEVRPTNVVPEGRPTNVVPEGRPTGVVPEGRPTGVVPEGTGNVVADVRPVTPAVNTPADDLARLTGTTDDIGQVSSRLTTRVEEATTSLEAKLTSTAGKEAIALKEELANLQQSTRRMATGTQDAAVDVNRSLEKLEELGRTSPFKDDIAKLAQDTRDLQTTLAASRRTTAIEAGTQTLVQTGDEIGRAATQAKSLLPATARAAETEIDEIARLGQTLGRSGDDIKVVRQIEEHLENIGRTAGKDVADDIARTMKPALQKAEAKALEVQTLKSATAVDETIAGMGRVMTEPQAVALRNELAVVQRSTREIAAGTDNMATHANLDQALRNLENLSGNGKYADEVQRLTQQVREMQTTASTARRAAAIENTSSTLAKTGEEIAQVANTAKAALPAAAKAAEAPLDEISRLSNQLGRGGNDAAIVRQINENVARVAETAGDDVARNLSRTLEPTLRRAETKAMEIQTLRSAGRVEDELANLSTRVTGREAQAIRQELNVIRQSTREIATGTETVNTAQNIDRALANLDNLGGRSQFADDITRITQQTREMQTTASAARRAAALEKGTNTLMEAGDEIGRAANTAKSLLPTTAKAAETEIDEIARLSRELGRREVDNVNTVRQINERLDRVAQIAGRDVADDIARTMRPSLQRAETAAMEVQTVRAATNVETRVASITERLAGPEAAAIRRELAVVQNGTRDMVAGVETAATRANVNTAIKNLETLGANTRYSDDLTRLAQETRELQTTVTTARNVRAIENGGRTLVRTGEEIANAANLARRTLPAAAGAELDEIARLSRTLGRNGDDVAVVNNINQRVARIAETHGDDAARTIRETLAPSIQRAENTAIEVNRLRNVNTLAVNVGNDARTISTTTRNIAAGLQDVTTVEGRVLRQQLQAIQRAADELPAAVNPATEASRIRTMVSAVERKLAPAESGALTTAARSLETTASEMVAARTFANQGRRIENAALQIQDDLNVAARVIKPGTSTAANTAVTASLDEIGTNVRNLQTKLGTTQTIETEVQNIGNAIRQLEGAGQTQLASRLRGSLDEIQNADLARRVEIAASRGTSTAERLAIQEPLVNATIQAVEQNLIAIRSFGSINRADKLEAIASIHENLQMLRHMAQTDSRLMVYVDEAQQLLSRIEMTAMARGSNWTNLIGTKWSVNRANESRLLQLAEAGNQQALNRLFVNGLTSDGSRVRSLAHLGDNVVGPTDGVLLGLVRRPEFYAASGRLAFDAALFAGGSLTLLGAYNYSATRLLRALNEQAALEQASLQTPVLGPDRSASATSNTLEVNTGDNSSDVEQIFPVMAVPAANRTAADMDFSPALQQVSRGVAHSNPATQDLAARYSLPETENEKWLEWIRRSGTMYGWGKGFSLPPVVEQVVTPVQTAKTVRIKGADATSDSTPRLPKPAVTAFNYAKATDIRNQLQLISGAGTHKGAGSVGSMASRGSYGSSVSSSLSGNLRTMVQAFNSFRADGSTHGQPVNAHMESTEDTGLDQGSGSGNTTPGGPQVTLAMVNDPASNNPIVTGINVQGQAPSSTVITSSVLREEALKPNKTDDTMTVEA